MTAPSKAFFPSPLQLGVLEEFCRPVAGHAMEVPRWDAAGGEALAGCGWFAIRVRKGLWMRDGSDVVAAPAGYLERFNKLPWESFETFVKVPELWEDLRTCANLYPAGALGLWQGNGMPAASPVWRVNETHVVRLSHLQLISRLPACQVYTGASENLHFRFSGGVGIVAKDKRLGNPTRDILQPKRDYTGGKAPRNEPRYGGLALPGKPWPPPEVVD